MEHQGCVNTRRSTMVSTTVAMHSTAEASGGMRKIQRARQRLGSVVCGMRREHKPTMAAQTSSVATMPQHAKVYVLLRCAMSLRVE